MAIIKNIIFDLDDTLFDTFNLLVKPATAEACQAMIEKGLKANINACIQAHTALQKNNNREDIFYKIAKHFGAKEDKKISELAQIGRVAFYKREIKENIYLFPEVRDVLERLKNKYTLHLLTIGDPQTQKNKIHLLDIAAYFQKIEIVDILKETNKKSGFQKILSTSQQQPNSFVSIGNRIDTDVAFAKELGMYGVFYEYGEYVHLSAKNKFETPDHTVKNMNEFERWLQNHAG